ncbi:hypothetical protein Tco_1291486 [Tanacetum coccineum]
MLKDSVINGPYKFTSEITAKDTDGVIDICREERLEDLKGDDKLHYDSDIKAVNILLLGLPVEIYTLINHYQTAKEIWDRVKELMNSTKITKQERGSMLYNEFDKFTSEPGESIHSYYLRHAKLINDMNMIPMSMTPMQINTKFVNHLQPEWSRFVTAAKQARDLHSVTFDQFWKYKGKLTKDATDQAQEAGVVLDEEQRDFLADSLEEIDDCEDLQLQATSNFKADYVDAYDSDCDNEAIANAIFMENLSPIDTVAPRYDSDTLSEVPHYVTYLVSDMLNSNIQELGYIENIISTNDSYDELKGNSDVISYFDYMLTIRDDADNYVPPLVQKDDMMLSVIKQMKSQVEKCIKVNQESKSEIESLTSELERYKDRVRVLGYAVKDGHSEQEAYLNHELYIVINDREQLYWSSIPSPHVTVSKPKVFPKKLPSTNEVLRNLNKVRDLLTMFEECIKRRTTLSPHEIGSWEQSDIKGTKLYYVTPFPKSKVIPKVVEKNDLSKSVTSHLTTNKIIEKCTKVLASGRVSSTNASGSMPRINTKNDRIPQPSSRSKKNKVEAHHRKFKSSANKNNHVSDCNANVKNVALSKNSDTICLSCNECLFSANHDACVVQYFKDSIT